MAMLTMLFDGGIAGDLREQLLISLQDQIDNVVGPKMARNMAVENGRTEGMGDRGALRNVSRLVDRAGRMGRVEPEEAEKSVPRTTQPVSGGHRESRRNNNISSAAAKTASPEPETPAKDFQIIKINLFNKAIFCKACFGMALKVIDIGGEPDWFSKIKFITDIIQ